MHNLPQSVAERQSRSEAGPQARRVMAEFQTAGFGLSPAAFPDFPQHERGFTLIELMISMVVLSGVLFGVYSVFASGTETYVLGVVKSDLERKATRVVEQIANSLSVSGRDSAFPRIAPPLSAAGVILQKSEGFADGAMKWGPVVLLVADYDIDETDDGKDNDGDGFIDEMIIVRRENPGEDNETLTVLTRGVSEYLEGERANGVDDNGNGLVDERGLSISVIGDVWTIRLTLVGKDARGRMIYYTAESSVTPRN